MNVTWLKKCKLQHVVLVLLLLVLSANYAALGYYREMLSQRDYSEIRDPQSRVTYCMASGTSISDKYTLAESIAHQSDFQVFSAVMKSAQRTQNPEDVRAAIRALKLRDELHERAHLISNRVATACGFWAIKWPKDVTPRDIHLRWLKFDSTYSHFVEISRSEPDAADRLINALYRKESDAGR